MPRKGLQPTTILLGILLMAWAPHLRADDKRLFDNSSTNDWNLQLLSATGSDRKGKEIGNMKIRNEQDQDPPLCVLGEDSDKTATAPRSFKLVAGKKYMVEFTHSNAKFWHQFRLIDWRGESATLFTESNFFSGIVGNKVQLGGSVFGLGSTSYRSFFCNSSDTGKYSDKDKDTVLKIVGPGINNDIDNNFRFMVQNSSDGPWTCKLLAFSDPDNQSVASKSNDNTPADTYSIQAGSPARSSMWADPAEIYFPLRSGPDGVYDRCYKFSKDDEGSFVIRIYGTKASPKVNTVGPTELIPTVTVIKNNLANKARMFCNGGTRLRVGPSTKTSW